MNFVGETPPVLEILKSTDLPRLTELVCQVFREVDSTRDVFAPQIPNSSAADISSAVPKTKDTGPDDYPDDEFEWSERRQEIRKKLAQPNGFECLAFYSPRLSNAASWGIYFDVFAMDVFVSDVLLQARRLDSSIGRQQVHDLVYKLVDFHELEHFAQEAQFALSVSAGNLSVSESIENWKKLFVLNPVKADRFDFREVLATRSEMLDASGLLAPYASGPIDLTIHDTYKRMPLPIPYKDWDRHTLQGLVREFAKASQDPKLTVATWRELQIVAHIRDSSRVPRRYFLKHTDLDDISPQLARAMGKISCNTLSSVMQKDSVLEKIGAQVTRGSKHDLKFKFKDVVRPTPLDCHAWGTGPVPSNILRQFVVGSGLGSRDRFIEFILANR